MAPGHKGTHHREMWALGERCSRSPTPQGIFHRLRRAFGAGGLAELLDNFKERGWNIEGTCVEIKRHPPQNPALRRGPPAFAYDSGAAAIGGTGRLIRRPATE